MLRNVSASCLCAHTHIQVMTAMVSGACIISRSHLRTVRSLAVVSPALDSLMLFQYDSTHRSVPLQSLLDQLYAPAHVI